VGVVAVPDDEVEPDVEVEPDDEVLPDVEPLEVPLVVIEVVGLGTLTQIWFEALERPAEL
jgi:hypothetical protein